MIAKTWIAVGLICFPLSSAVARSAVINNDYSHLVHFGLFNWEQERGEMVTSFVVTNRVDRPLISFRIDCEFGLTAPGHNRSTRKISKLLEAKPPSEAVMSAKTTLHFRYITFGQIEPVDWVKDMTCRVGEVTY